MSNVRPNKPQRLYGLPLQELGEEFHRILNLGTCLHFDAPEGCNEVIDAHSVTRSWLQLVADDRARVMHVERKPVMVMKGDGNFVPAMSSISTASTYRCFCKHHDLTQFVLLENERPLTPETAPLGAYRAVCRDLHIERVAALAFDVLWRDSHRTVEEMSREMPVGDVASDLVGIMQVGAARRRGAFNRSLDEKLAWDLVIAGRSDGDSAGIDLTIVRFDAKIDVAFTALFDSHIGVRGDLIGVRGAAPIAAFTHHAADSSALVLAWRSGDDHCARFAQEVETLSPNELIEFTIGLGFTYPDNAFWRPSWWKTLIPVVRAKLMGMGHPVTRDRKRRLVGWWPSSGNPLPSWNATIEA